MVLLHQRGPHRRLGRAVLLGDQFLHRFQRRTDLFLAGAGDLGDCGPHRCHIEVCALLVDQVELVDQDAAGLGRQLGGPLQPGQHTQAFVGGLAAGRADQPGGHQQGEQIESVVDRPGLQAPGDHQQRRGPARLDQPVQGRRLAARPVLGQGLHPPYRHLRHRNPAQLESGQVVRPL
ncbi:hypothetical protein HD596_001700 [Nonomuraea jabiensis]|uniref:Uncharacterized protein n=1 Tax=Nonomuraea jabiensis TaxID=882448 RepID=A0A7W9L8W0_9ACTN|nr:hypothetical protein [Nonomuraea jabiensis]MBB5774944.1 hypothetical protein [Nonomuraea jabiensis]